MEMAEAETGKFVVFMSYGRKDEPFVVRLARDLEGKGVRVWRDRCEIEPGDSFVAAIGEALESCQFFLLVLSTVSARSRWVEHEWNCWMSLQLSEERQVSQAHQLSRRRLIPVLLGDAVLPTFLRPIESIRIGVDGCGYQEGLDRILGLLIEPSRTRRSLEFSTGKTEDLVGSLKFASNLLRGLLNNQFERLLPHLDPQGFVGPASPDEDPARERTRRVEELIKLMIQRGPSFILALQEAILAVRSPFSPFDEKSLENWVGRPPECWQIANSQIIGAGCDPPMFHAPGTPTELQCASELTWEGLMFRDGEARARIWVPFLDLTRAVGLALRSARGRRAVVGLLRGGQSEGTLAVELWRREGTCLRLLASVPCPPNLLAGGSCWLTLEGGRDRIYVNATSETSSDGASTSFHITDADDRSPGHFGLLKFGGASVMFGDLQLAVRAPMNGPTA